jgi:signal peptidase I
MRYKVVKREAVKTRLVRFWHSWGKLLLVTILLVTSFRSAVADWNDVPTGSMKPTILEGDRIFVNKLAYDLKVPFTRMRVARWGEPQRGEMVVFFSPVDGTRLVKRVVGVPGDVIAMRDHRLLINGEQATYEPAGREGKTFRFTETLAGSRRTVQFTADNPGTRSFPEMPLEDGHYFMMGDNRCNSADSRFFGAVEMDRIVGRVSTVVLSVDRDDHYLPRWDRFFHRLD